jgi:hypothetical protein
MGAQQGNSGEGPRRLNLSVVSQTSLPALRCNLVLTIAKVDELLTPTSVPRQAAGLLALPERVVPCPWQLGPLQAS